jgi:hypothetical protein
MINFTWSAAPIETFSLEAGAVASLWLMAHEELIGAATYLKLKASGKWEPMAGLPACGPDGLCGQSFPDDRLIVTDCPVGALIGRVGGSSAVLKATAAVADAGESKPFPMGTYTVLKLPEKVIGPLYVGFNILLRPVRIIEPLTLDIFTGSGG